jgi:hypothetical protein
MGVSACRQAAKTEVGQIVPENEVEIALVASSQGRAAPGRGLPSVLPSARVYLVTRRDAVTKDGELRDHSQVTYLTEMVKGREAMALFTSERRTVERFGPGVPYIFMPGIDALRLAKGLPVVINPGLSPSAFIKAQDVVKIVKHIERRERPYREA